MNRLPIIVLGGVFALGGLALALVTLRRPKPSDVPLKKSEVRAREAEQVVFKKQRIAGAVLVAIGVVMVFLV
jgi:hypothetical protein